MVKGFGWVDHRLVRKGYFKERSREALALYLFLITVSDSDGLSYYSEESLCEQLNFKSTELWSSRLELADAELIAYRRPFYQVLRLPSDIKESFAEEKTECTHIGELLDSAMEGKQDD
jgi:hypothetical protein